MKGYKDKRKQRRTVKSGVVTWDKWREVFGDWSILELLNPTDLVLEDCAERYTKFILSEQPGCTLPSKAKMRDEFTQLARKYPVESPDAILRAIPGIVERAGRKYAENMEYELDMMEQSGLFISSFLNTLPLFCEYRTFEKYQRELSPMEFTCALYYKALGVDATPSKDDMREVFSVVDAMMANVGVESRWFPIIFMYMLAYSRAVCRKEQASIQELEDKCARLQSTLDELRRREPEVRVVEKQVGADKLKAAEEEAQQLRNDMEKYRLSVRSEYKDALSEKDTRIAMLEQLLQAKEYEEAAVLEEAALAHIPMEGVLFVCAYEPVCSSVAQVFPKWKFVTSNTSSIPTDVSCVIVCTPYVSHSLVYRVKSAVSVPVYYTTRSNIALIIQDVSYQM